VGDEVVGEWVAFPAERDRGCGRPLVAGAHARRECVAGPVATRRHLVPHYSAGSGSGARDGTPRASTYATRPETPSRIAEPAHTHRGPYASLSSPPATKPPPNAT